jgi:hypothetical protein
LLGAWRIQFEHRIPEVCDAARLFGLVRPSVPQEHSHDDQACRPGDHQIQANLSIA